MIDNLAIGLTTALSFSNLLYCFLGVLIGTIIGVIPGIGVMAGLSMLIPITFHLDPTGALIMLAGIWYGTTYGGSTASILLNLPGTPVNAVTCLDGYPMAQQGRAGVALFMTTIASFVGGSVGIVLLMILAPVISDYALRFQAAEYFMLMLLGVVAASSVSSGSVFKSLIMVVTGILLGTIGVDMYSGTQRFTFGSVNLAEGIGLIAVAMGIFGLAEVMVSAGLMKQSKIDPATTRLSAMLPTREDVRRSWRPMIRGSAIGSFFGALPGTGSSIAAFMSYGIEKRSSKHPEEFGKGAIEGIMGPESANNAADQTSFIPTLTLGIPGSAAMALILGALFIHGVQPGPKLMIDQPSLFWGLVMSFWIGNILLLVLNIPAIGLWVRLLLVPYHILFPIILVFICVGTFTSSNNPFSILLLAAFGVLGYFMRVFGYAAAPLLLGVVLGPMMEEYFRRAMMLSNGSWMTFIDRPLSAAIGFLTLVMFCWGLWPLFRRRS